MQESISKQTWIIGAAGTVVLVASYVAATLLWRPPVIERDHLPLLKLVHTAVSNRDLKQVASVKKTIEHHRECGGLTDKEGRAFDAVLLLAEKSEWKPATEKVFALMKAQQSRRRPPSDPKGHHHGHSH